jgi:L-ascorbate metabolism protein UlaG (beta-lactamase superfamily)
MRLRVPFRITKLRQLWRLVRESHAQRLIGQPQVPPTAAPGTTAVTFIGHSSFLIQMGGRALLIDPVFATRLILLRRKRRPGVRIADLPPIDAVLLTHAHMDHLNVPSLRAICRSMRRRHLKAPVAIVPNGVEDLVRNLGFERVESLEWWQSTRLADLPRASACARTEGPSSRDTAGLEDEIADSSQITVTAVPARHWGARMFNDTHRGFGGYVLQCTSTPSIYHSGDTAYFSGFAEIARRMHPAIALLPIGAYFPDSYRTVHTSPEEALRAFVDLGAEVMIPMHYNTFRLGREPMDEPLSRLLRAAERASLGARVIPLEEGSTWIADNSLRIEDIERAPDGFQISSHTRP